MHLTIFLNITIAGAGPPGDGLGAITKLTYHSGQSGNVRRIGKIRCLIPWREGIGQASSIKLMPE